MTAQTRKTTSTTEDYLKVILQMELSSRQPLAPMGKVAESMNITPGTVTTMVKRLQEDGLAVYEPRKGCRLTHAGRVVALRMLRRHRILETFLVRELKLDWSEVHGEAENMEHGVSEIVIDRLWDYLGHPDKDPHGGPIPDKALRLPDGPPDSVLNDFESGTHLILTNLPDRDPLLLNRLKQIGAHPGALVGYFRVPREGGSLKGPMGEVKLTDEEARRIWAIRNSI